MGKAIWQINRHDRYRLHCCKYHNHRQWRVISNENQCLDMADLGLDN